MFDLKKLKKHYSLPDWVYWIAQDEDGAVWGYEVEPLQHHCGWYENEVGRHVKIIQLEPEKNWCKTLHRNL